MFSLLEAQSAFPQLDLQERVLIIGAGAAGIVAAAILNKLGLRTTVLEARDRIGGRIWTVTGPGAVPIDLGASWIHGTEGNPLMELAHRCGARLIATDRSRVALFTRRLQLVPREEIRRLAPLFQQLLSDAKQIAFRHRRDMSLSAGLLRAMLHRWRTLPKGARVLRWAWGAFELVLGTRTHNLSARYWDQDVDLAGGDRFVASGYLNLLRPLLDGLDIRLGQAVRTIRWRERGPVVVVTNRGEEFEAERLLCTLPLGVLKAGTVRFVPPLPPWKQAAIDRLGFGCLDKVILLFPRVFWNDDVDYLGFLTESPGGYAYFVNLHRLCGIPALMGFVTGRRARLQERTSDEKVVARAMKPLRRTFGRVPEPEQYWLTRWGRDEFSLGSYSYLPVGALGSEFDVLRCPVGDRLFFAGEATHRVFPGAVHGAVLSAIEAALRIAACARSDATLRRSVCALG